MPHHTLAARGPTKPRRNVTIPDDQWLGLLACALADGSENRSAELRESIAEQMARKRRRVGPIEWKRLLLRAAALDQETNDGRNGGARPGARPGARAGAGAGAGGRRRG